MAQFTIPKELLALLNEQIWCIFKTYPGSHKKHPLRLPDGNIPSCNNPNTLMTYDEAMKLVNTNQVLAVSLALASEHHGEVIRIVDLDNYKDKYDERASAGLEEETFIDYSISGKGYHIWYSFNIKPTRINKYSGVDNLSGFTILSGNVYKNEAIKYIELVEEELAARDKYSSLTLMNGSMQSVIFAFNLQNPIESILLDNGFELKQGNKWLSPESDTGAAGGKIFPSNNNPYDLFYTHNETGLEGIAKKAVDAFDLYKHFNHQGDKSEAAKALSRRVKAIDDETGEILDITVGEFNKRPSHYIPQHLLYPDDQWGELVHSIENATQYRKNPVAAMCNAFTSVGALAGGAYTTADKDSTDIFIVPVGSSKCGKSVTMAGAQDLFPLSAIGQIHHRMAGSEEGMQDAMLDSKGKPDLLFLIDEIGFVFQDFKKNKNSGGGDRWQTLLERLAAGHRPTSTRALAKTDATFIPYPNIVILGNTTIEALKGGLEKRDVETGAINRILFFDSSQNVSVKKKGKHTINEIVKERLFKIFKVGAEMSVDDRRLGFVIDIDPDVAELMFIQDSLTEVSNMKARLVQMAFKFAFLRAIYCDSNVTLAYYKWGYALVEHSLQYVEYLFNVHLSSRLSQEVIAERKLKAKLEAHGGKLSRTDAKNIGELNRMGATKRKALLEALEGELFKEVTQGKKVLYELLS